VSNYDTAIVSELKGFQLCAGCEDEFVLAEDVYCAVCAELRRQLEERYASTHVDQQRVDAGIAYFAQPQAVTPNFLGRLPPRTLLALAGGVAMGAAVIFCAAGWWGLRAIVSLGIRVAQ
jgi:hypothetical protein